MINAIIEASSFCTIKNDPVGLVCEVFFIPREVILQDKSVVSGDGITSNQTFVRVIVNYCSRIGSVGALNSSDTSNSSSAFVPLCTKTCVTADANFSSRNSRGCDECGRSDKDLFHDFSLGFSHAPQNGSPHWV